MLEVVLSFTRARKLLCPVSSQHEMIYTAFSILIHSPEKAHFSIKAI